MNSFYVEILFISQEACKKKKKKRLYQLFFMTLVSVKVLPVFTLNKLYLCNVCEHKLKTFITQQNLELQLTIILISSMINRLHSIVRK